MHLEGLQMEYDTTPVLDLSIKKNRRESVDSYSEQGLDLTSESRRDGENQPGGRTYKKNLMKRYRKFYNGNNY